MDNGIDAALTRLLSFPKRGSGVGLPRFVRLAAPLFERPWLQGLEAIRVTGSNGKGSVAAMTSALLQALSIPTGLYVSPHLFRWNERVAVGGQHISDHEIVRAMAWLEGRLAEYAATHPDETVGAFEAFTAVALHALDARAPKALVAEAGIGGRFDPTRALPGGLVALTSVDLEHTELLGDTAELIAYDKADLTPAGGHLVTGRLPDALFAKLVAYGKASRFTVERATDRLRVGAVSYGRTHTTADVLVDGMRIDGLRLRPLGRHQIDNAALALVLVRRFLTRTGREELLQYLPQAARVALTELGWPGRFERVHTEPEVFVDVGHTPDAALNVARTARDVFGGEPVLLVLGVSRDKDAAGIAAALAPIATEVFVTRSQHRGGALERVRDALLDVVPGLPITLAPTVSGALAAARARGLATGYPILVAGSLFLAVESIEVLAGRDPAGLRFF